jgi:hypothetical protein
MNLKILVSLTVFNFTSNTSNIVEQPCCCFRIKLFMHTDCNINNYDINYTFYITIRHNQNDCTCTECSIQLIRIIAAIL